MATLILGTVGRIVAGPIGAIVGTLIGSGIDRTVFGSASAREQGRISNTAVQSATYGEPIPIVVGRMRTAGNLIWTSGIRESTATSGGGKRGGQTTTFSYSASFAVGLVGRRIIEIGRIWADGKLMRDAGSNFLTPVTMRLHDGDADQDIDPLIAAAEGIASTPAYRGLAYAVFEDLPLADYGNRIPNLTFEIIADAETANFGDVFIGLADAAGFPALQVDGIFPTLTGYIAARAGSLADVLAPLLAISNAALAGHSPMTVTGSGVTPLRVPAAAADAQRPAEARAPDRQRRAAAGSQPASLELAFYDTSREYQPGLQRARWSSAHRFEQQSVAAAMTPEQAKALAIQQLASGKAARSQRSLRLPWRYVGIAPGALVQLGGGAELWRVREARFENFITNLELERVQLTAPPAATVRFADGGRASLSESQPAGPTMLHVLDLPPLTGDLPATPRLWIAGNGAGAGWRRADVLISTDAGESFAPVGVLEGGTVIGSTLTVLGDGACSRWDRFSSVDIELLAARDWLESRAIAAVLDGANLALVGEELIQFQSAEALAPQQFRLRGLLRGRRGTEAATAGHKVGERFVLVDPLRMLPFDPPLDALGRSGLARPAGNGDVVPVDTPFRVKGAALRPLAPVHARAKWLGDDLTVEWVRRSRAGFAWTDFVDASLAEDVEAYQIDVRLDGRSVRQVRVMAPRFVYPATDRLADGGGAEIEIAISKWSAAVGPGASIMI